MCELLVQAETSWATTRDASQDSARRREEEKKKKKDLDDSDVDTTQRFNHLAKYVESSLADTPGRF